MTLFIKFPNSRSEKQPIASHKLFDQKNYSLWLLPTPTVTLQQIVMSISSSSSENEQDREEGKQVLWLHTHLTLVHFRLTSLFIHLVTSNHELGEGISFWKRQLSEVKFSLNNKVVKEWISKAEGDYEAARWLIRKRGRSLFDIICFHCQQCSEKYLKAYLTMKQRRFPKTNDLVELLNLSMMSDGSFELLRNVILPLNDYAVVSRYPGE